MSDIAQANFERHIRQNVYPGRGLVIGRASAGNGWLMIYWIMGRSANSQNRRFVADGDTLRTEPVDPAKVEDASLIIYEAMLALPPHIFLVSNGDQTRTIYEALQAGRSFDAALASREREPDAPNYTPRISGMLDLESASSPVTLSILKANAVDPRLTDRFTYRPAPPPPGLGYGLTTYRGDGQPLPSFAGDPLLLPCTDDPETILDRYWDALNGDFRVALAVKTISPGAGIRSILIRSRFDGCFDG